MAAEEARKYVQFLRSCEKELPEPVTGEIKGTIPTWLRGTLIRNGGGTLNINKDRFNHIFDGMALLHKFSIQDGQVTYLNKFLRSDTYRKNMEAGRITVAEFGTKESPDPCKTIFQKFMSTFSASEMTDNDLVNVVQYSDEFYAHSETNYIWKFDPETLEAQKKVALSQYVPIKMATAHTHEGKDGAVYNIGNAIGSKNGYTIVKFPPKKEKSDGAFDRGSVVAKIPFSKFLRPSYYHSFGLSENYVIFVEQPVYLSVWNLAVKATSASEAMSFTHEKARIYVVRRQDGVISPIRYTTDCFFVFHHINAYEENGHLVVDMCSYEDGQIVNDLYVKALEEKFSGPDRLTKCPFSSRAKRYVLPLEELLNEKGSDENIVKLPGSKATAKRLADGTVHCTPQILAESDDLKTELPRINYAYNELKYKYFYAVAKKSSDEDYSLVKVNVENGATHSWSEPGKFVSEPVFIQKPGSDEEDGGVLVSSLLDREDETTVALIVLDAKKMTEIARVNFKTETSIPGDFHGIFIRNQK